MVRPNGKAGWTLSSLRGLIVVCLALVLAGFTGITREEGPNIHGVVKDLCSGGPIPGAVVILRGTALQTVTDERRLIADGLRLTLPDFDTDLAVRFWREE